MLYQRESDNVEETIVGMSPIEMCGKVTVHSPKAGLEMCLSSRCTHENITQVARKNLHS